MFICQIARRNLSDDRDDVLPWWKHAYVTFHFTVCPPCRRFKASFERTMGALAAMRDKPREAGGSAHAEEPDGAGR